MGISPAIPTDPTRSLMEADAVDCAWNAQLRTAGVEPISTRLVDQGVPILVLVVLAIAAMLALIAPDSGESLALGAGFLLVGASLPWFWWLRQGDTGPSWEFAVIAMLPIALLGIGQWFTDTMSLGSTAAWVAVVFPALFLMVLAIGSAWPSMAAAISGIAWIAIDGPLLAAWIAGREIDAVSVTTLHVMGILALVAGYAMRFSYNANQAVTAAREALAWQAAGEERRQIARDVHDVVAHTMAVTMLHVTGARMAVQRGDSAAAVSALEEAERQGRASLADIRRIVRLLRADDRDATGSAAPGLAEFDSLVEGYRSAGLDVAFEHTVNGERPSASAELALYRVLQESLANAVRHGAGPAMVVLRSETGAVSLRVTNPIRAVSTPTTRGSGLTGMRERIAAAGGTLEAGPHDGRWQVAATVPIEAVA